LKWNKYKSIFSARIPPVTWLFGDDEGTPDEVAELISHEIEI
jgi:hypothetical protein